MTETQRVSELADHLGYWLRFVSNHVSQGFAQKLAARGVTPAEWVVLRELLRSGPSHASQIAEALGMTRGAISKLVDRLAGKRLVTRTTTKRDQRFQIVALTESGKTLTPALAALADDNDHEYFGHLKPQERAQLLGLLQGLVARHGWHEVPTR
jgi:DNA-binding MarR family transcriptional regulator